MSKAKRKEKKAIRAEKKAVRKAEVKKGGGTKVGKFMRKVKSKAVNLGKDAPFAVLLPFKAPMKNYLKKKHINHDNSLKDIAVQFVKAKGGLSIQEEQFLDAVNFDDGYSADEKKLDPQSKQMLASGVASAGANAAIGNYAGAATSIIKTIIDFFKHLKEKKEKGEALTEAEQNLLDDAEKVVSNIEEAAIEEGKNTTAGIIRDFLFSWKGALALLALIVLCYFAFSK